MDFLLIKLNVLLGRLESPWWSSVSLIFKALARDTEGTSVLTSKNGLSMTFWLSVDGIWMRVSLLWEFLLCRKMDDITEHYSRTMRYHFHVGFNAAQTARRICAIYGLDALKECVVQKWFVHFYAGNFNGAIGSPVNDGHGQNHNFNERKLASDSRRNPGNSRYIARKHWGASQSR
jgi:hypothetical protein